MSFVRTVLGDVPPDQLGTCDAHEHLVIDGGLPCVANPDFRLADVDLAVAELAECHALGLRAVIDAMPCDAGRNVAKLAEIARRTGVSVVCSTGVHHERYYDDLHWSRRFDSDTLAELFVADLEHGVDANDYGAPLVARTPHRAGVVKVAGSLDTLTERDRRAFVAAARAHSRTGCPILTHTEQGTAGIEQAELLLEHGVAPTSVVISHTDYVADPGYHADVLATGVFLEYDRHFRWRDGSNPTIDRIVEAFESGLGSQVLVGMDAARQGYWRAYGGRPGLSYLLGELAERLRDRGLDGSALRLLFVENPARAYAWRDGA